MEEQLLLIPQIELGNENWTTKVTVIEDMPVLTSRKTQARYKRYVVVDAEGNEMLAVAFGNAVTPVTNTLQPFKVFKISNAELRVASPEYQMIGNNKVQWVLQRSTLIRPMPLDEPNLSTLTREIVPFNMLVDKLPKPEDTKPKIVSVDIMALVIRADNPKDTTSPYGPGTVQKFILVDMNKKTVNLSLWDEMITVVGPLLEEAAASYSVLLGKRLKLQEYKGDVALSSRNLSSFTINPPLEEAAQLKAWFDSVRETELPNLLTDYSVSFSRDLLNRNLMHLSTVAQIIASEECRDYWTRASMQISLGDQKLYYIGCSNCFAKVDSIEGIDYTCMLCKKDVTSSMRLLVSMDISDRTCQVTAGALEFVAEEILQTTTADLSRLIKLRVRYDLDTIRAELENKQFLILLRRTYSRGTSRRSSLLLVGFFDETVDGKANLSVPQTDPDNVSATLVSSQCLASAGIDSLFPENKSPHKGLSISPLKRQMDGIVIGTGGDGSPAKKQLTFGAGAIGKEDDGASPTVIGSDAGNPST